MAEPDSTQPYTEARSESRYGKCAGFAQHSPWQNHLLAALRLEDYERLLSDLEPAPLPLNLTIHYAAGRDKYPYFITEGIVSRCYTTESGQSTDYAVAGSEGEYARGHIAVLDLPLLKAHACECNGVIQREYARLLSAEKSIRIVGLYGRA